MENLLDLPGSIPVSLDTLLVNLLLCLVLGLFLAWFYTRYGRTFTNRSKLASTLPVLALTVLLVISVVKSSLALSLGLVGALSVVRFRTAIKEPEELIYLFIAIALGIGLGADQRAVTVAAFVVIIAYLFANTTLSPRRQKSNLFLNITTPDTKASFSEINEVLLAHTSTANLRRLDHLNGSLHATYLIDCSDDSSLSHLMDDLKSNVPGSEFSFVEQDNTIGG
ncbi:MAG TPA: DUF4956 domain-containing protein [Chloroflexi bacterium]|jgi:hypothetical protein|nr:DUF4956 domain-containing protein [Chloroflexota bacterium]